MSRGLAANAPQDDIGEIEDKEFAKLFDEHLRAGYQCLYIPTSEESRLELEITRVAKNLKMGVITWDCFEGFSYDPLKGPQFDKYKSPIAALGLLANEEEAASIFTGNHVFVFRDLDDYFVDHQVRRRIRSLCEGVRLVNKRHKRPLVIVSPKLDVHPKLKSSVYPLEFNLPSEDKLRKTFDFVKLSIESKDPNKAKCSPELADGIVSCLLGLTSAEAENALARCLVRHSGFKPEMLGTIKDEKAAIVKKSDVLTYIPESNTAARSEIGGFDQFLDWLDRRKLAYTKQARSINLDYPKGVVLMGLPGTGKSMVGKAASRLLGIPGYSMDVGSVFGSLVGESEQRMRDALRQVEAQKGCVLILDEADKAFGGAVDSQGDSGVTRRVFGQMLQWLAEKQDKTFVIMTLNRTAGLPPELLRAGRFDELFYTDLPSDEERRQIIEIHFRKRGVDPAQLGFGDAEWQQIIEKTTGYVGSELEEVVRNARYRCFESRQVGVPTFEEVLEEAGSVVSMSQRDPDGINKIREYCKDKGKCVSYPKTAKAGRRGRTRSVDVDAG